MIRVFFKEKPTNMYVRVCAYQLCQRAASRGAALAETP